MRRAQDGVDTPGVGKMIRLGPETGGRRGHRKRERGG